MGHQSDPVNKGYIVDCHQQFDHDQTPRKKDPMEHPDMLELQENIDEHREEQISEAKEREQQISESTKRLLLFEQSLSSISSTITPHKIALFVVVLITFISSFYFLAVF